jgi:HK97 family phage major capsid protein
VGTGWRSFNVTLANVPEGANEQAAYAIRQMLAIRSAAGDRDFTRSQEQDYDELTVLFDAATQRLGGTSAYARSLINEFKSSPARTDVLEDLAKTLNYEQLRGANDAFRGQGRAIVERSAGNNDVDIRALVRDAFAGRDTGFSAAISPSMFAQRTLQSAGGSAFNDVFADRLIAYQRTFSPLIDPSITRVVARTNGAPYIQPRLTSDASAGGTTTAESGNISLLDPTISSVTITPAKRAAITKVTSELMEDEDIDLEQLVIETTGRAIGIALGTALTGTLLAGISNGGTASGTANGAPSWTFVGPPDLATLYTSVAAPYRSKGVWLVSTTALAHLYKMRDENQQPILFNSTGGGQPTLFGRPVVEDPGLAALGSATKSIVFGDLQQALTVVRRTPIDVLVSRHVYYSTDEVGIRVIDRSAGGVIDAAAASYLVSANT